MRRLLLPLLLLLASCSAPEAVREAHSELGANALAVASSYRDALLAAPETAQRDAALAALATLIERIDKEHAVVADYLEAQGLFKDDAERDAFLSTVREVATR